MDVHSPAIVVLVRLEWSGVNYQQEPCCPECDAPLYGKHSAVAFRVTLPRILPPYRRSEKPYHTLEPGSHFPHCLLDEALRTQEDLQTPQEREEERKRHQYNL